MIAFWIFLVISATIVFVGYPLFESLSVSDATIEEEVARLRKKSRQGRELFCPVCGADYRLGDKFCQQCGSKINSRRTK